MKQIQWFPGHMAKALKQMQGQIDVVDVVIELVDSRVPFASRNPEIISLEGKKPILMIMSKLDLANKDITKKWISYYESRGISCLATNINKLNYLDVKNKCLDLLKEKRAKDLAKGLRPRPIRALVVGIPNVGKSTFINKMAKRKATNTGNKPGVTKSTQYIKIDQDFVLLDTPGVLWPNFEDKRAGLNLALIGSIKQEILPKEKMCFELLKLLTDIYPGSLASHYKIEEFKVNNEQECNEIINRIAVSRSFIKTNNQIDELRAIEHILKEFADGKIGQFTLEVPSDGG